MKIGRLTNGTSCEYDMQNKFSEWLEKQNISFIDEHYVSEVKRRPDFTLYYDGKLINVEAKCNDHQTLIKQMKDHAKYCDYCFAFIPDYSMTPKWFKKELLKHNFGLIVYNFKTKEITEVLEAHHNKPKNRKLRLKVIGEVEKISDEKIKSFSKNKQNDIRSLRKTLKTKRSVF